jgi:drug/metabolite transporter (DMT)-like permease
MKLKNLLLMFVLASLWGPSFLFIKVAIEDIPPLTMALGRIGIAAILLNLFLRLKGRRLPKFGPFWKHFALIALIHNAVPFALFGWGEQYIDSALAAVLNGTVPLFTILLAHFFTQDDHITPVKAWGVLLGFGGLLLLIAPSFAGGVQATTWGILAITLASFLYGVAIVYSRNHMRGLPPVVAPAGQMLMATIYLLPVSLLVDRPFSLATPSIQSVASLFALGIFGTAIAFIVYYRLVETAAASIVSMTTYIIPIFGVILGVAVLNEQLTWHVYAGCVLILLGVMIVNGVFKVVGWPRPALLGKMKVES